LHTQVRMKITIWQQSKLHESARCSLQAHSNVAIVCLAYSAQQNKGKQERLDFIIGDELRKKCIIITNHVVTRKKYVYIYIFIYMHLYVDTKIGALIVLLISRYLDN